MVKLYPRLWLSLLALSLVLAMAGCAEDRCQGEAPAFQVQLSLTDASILSRLATLRVDVSAAGLHKVADLDSDPLKSRGHTTFVVVVGQTGAGGFAAEVQVTLLDPAGEHLLAVSQSFSGSGNACNFFSLELQPPHVDGPARDLGPERDGPLPDRELFVDLSGEGTSCGPSTCAGCCLADGRCVGGTTETACGQGGESCANCAASSGLCRAQSCCTPTCAGKPCGADDGCGGSCATGSCAAGQVCVSGSCRCTAQSCADGCCTGDQQCLAGTQNTACGSGGAACTNCSAAGQTCTNQRCACVPVCPADSCNVSDGCGGTCRCGTNEYCDSTTCEPLLCQLCTDTGDCTSQCIAWGSTGGSCAAPGSTTPAHCCECAAIASSYNPSGVLDGVTVDGVASGWACDRDNPWASIIVHIYVGGPAGSGAPGYATMADRFSEAAIKLACNGGDYHRFRYTIPNVSTVRGQPVYAYGINIVGGNTNPLLAGSPRYVP